MSKAISLVAALGALGAITVASTAGATGPAPYNVPKQTSKLSLGLVTAYQQCTAPGLSHRPALALPSCAPPVASSTLGLNGNTDVFTFGTKNGKPDGSASSVFQAVVGDFRISFKSKNVWKNGSAFTSSPGPVPPDDRLRQILLFRFTGTGCLDPVNPVIACTLVDFPLPFAFNCVDGACTSAAATFNSLLPNAMHAGDTLNIEMGQVSVVRPGINPDTVFRSGLFVK